eukprot:gene14007-29828_t
MSDITLMMRNLAEGGILSGIEPLYDPLSLFLVQAVIIIGITRALSFLGGILKQPRVIFEVIGGILLGPSALGRNKYFLDTIFPAASLNYLSLVANIGLVLYLFIVGMELDPVMLVTHAKRSGLISIAGIALPFALGVAVSPSIYDNLLIVDEKYKDVTFTSFFVFMGTAMSITAFPVLARILKESGLIYSRAGVMTMGAAAIDDAIAWCLLILAISIANAGDLITALYVFLCVICFASGLFIIINPIFSALVTYVEASDNRLLKSNLFAFTICIMFLSAWTTALLGVHAIFGAFLFGLIVPRDSHLFHECNERIEDFVMTIMLPLYFAVSGLKTDVTQINTPIAGGLLILVCFVATMGKLVGCGVTAHFSGLQKREAFVVAVLMNTRGLVELIVLNLGMQYGILNIPVFSIMVLMALFTTFMTGPVIELVYPVHKRKLIEDEEKELMQDPEAGMIQPLSDNMIPESSAVLEISPVALTKEAKIALMIDRTEQVAGLLDFLYLFAPKTDTTSLSVRAVQFVEPTLTEKDAFLGLNEDGRVVFCDKKATDIAFV